MHFFKVSLLDQYVLRNLFLILIAITSVLLGALWLTSSVHFIEIILNQTEANSFFLLLKIAFLLLPDLLSLILPFSLFFSVLYVYNRLSMDRELIVMRALGLSNKRLAFPALLLGFFITLLLLGMNIFLLPKTFSSLRDLEYKLRNTVSISILKEGEFNTFPGLNLFLRKKMNNGEIHGIFVYSTEQPNKPYTLVAQKGYIRKDPSQGIYLALEKGIRQEKNPKTYKTQFLYFDNTVVMLETTKKKYEPRPKKPAELSLSELLFPNTSLYNKDICLRLQSEAHQRLLLPILPFCFILMAMVGFSARSYKRTGFIKEITAIVLGAILLEALTFLLIHFAAKFSYITYGAYFLVFGTISALSYVLIRSDSPAPTSKKKDLI